MKNLAIVIYHPYEHRPWIEPIEYSTIEVFNQYVEKGINCVLVDMDSYDGVGTTIIAEHFDGEVKFY